MCSLKPHFNRRPKNMKHTNLLIFRFDDISHIYSKFTCCSASNGKSESKKCLIESMYEANAAKTKLKISMTLKSSLIFTLCLCLFTFVYELPHKPSILWSEAINSVYSICVLRLWFFICYCLVWLLTYECSNRDNNFTISFRKKRSVCDGKFRHTFNLTVEYALWINGMWTLGTIVHLLWFPYQSHFAFIMFYDLLTLASHHFHHPHPHNCKWQLQPNSEEWIFPLAWNKMLQFVISYVPSCAAGGCGYISINRN